MSLGSVLSSKVELLLHHLILKKALVAGGNIWGRGGATGFWSFLVCVAPDGWFFSLGTVPALGLCQPPRPLLLHV